MKTEIEIRKEYNTLIELRNQANTKSDFAIKRNDWDEVEKQNKIAMKLSVRIGTLEWVLNTHS